MNAFEAETGAMSIKTFVYDGTPIRICTDGTNQTWIASNDVAKAIGVSNPRNVSRRMDEIDKLTQKVHTANGPQSLTFVSMWGLTMLAGSTRDDQKTSAFLNWFLRTLGNHLAQRDTPVFPSNPSASSSIRGTEWKAFGTSPFRGNPLFHCKEPWDGVSTPDPARAFHPEPGSSWEKVALTLKETLGDAIFRSWITKLSFDFTKEDTVVLQVANAFLKDTIAQRYTYQLLKAWQVAEPHIQTVDIRIARIY